TLNTAHDATCINCGTRLDRAGLIAKIEAAETAARTPAWVYFFATLCALIPIVALGGLIPIGIGACGAVGCLKVGRTFTWPSAVRVMVCIGIVIGAWIAFLISMAMLAKAIHR